MHTTRSRRIIRRAVMALAVVVLLPVWYVGTWLVLSRAAREDMIDGSMTAQIRPAFVPLIWYCNSDLAGAELLHDIWWTTAKPRKFAGREPPEWSLRYGL